MIFLTLLVIASAYYALIYIPLQQKVSELKLSSSELSNEIRLYDAYLNSVDSIRDSIDTLRAEVNELHAGRFTVNGKNLVYELQDAILQSGVIPKSISLGEPGVIYSASGVTVNTLSFDVSLTCTYRQLMSFISFFESSEFTYYHILTVDTGNLMESSDAMITFIMYYPERTGS